MDKYLKRPAGTDAGIPSKIPKQSEEEKTSTTASLKTVKKWMTVLNVDLDYAVDSGNVVHKITCKTCKDFAPPNMSSQMSPCPRRSCWSYRSIKLKIQGFPQQLCRACWRLAERVCETDSSRYFCIFITLCLLCCLFFGWVLHRDSCFQWEIQHTLCEDYQRGLIAGALCYDLCVEKLNILSSCIDKSPKGLSFRHVTGKTYSSPDVTVETRTLQWQDLIVKAPGQIRGRRGRERTQGQGAGQGEDNSVWEGMTYSDFWDALENYFTVQLGADDHSSLIERTFAFGDFNKDGEMTFGEIHSMWQLLQIPEFLTLFIFQHNTVFPVLNATCGQLYSYRRTSNTILYTKTRNSVWDKVFPHRYRWHFPSFPKRVHIALGLLEYASLVMEAEHMRFHMCDFNPKNFGYTEYYEMVVTNVEGILSEVMLNQTLLERPCERNLDCAYGLCQSTCDTQTGYCRGISPGMKPDLVKICEILLDYILYDSPMTIRFTISELISRCRKIGRTVYLSGDANLQMEQNVILDEFNKVLWDQLKNEKLKWLSKTTAKPLPAVF